MAHHRAGQWEAAERLYQSVLQAHPGHPDAHHNLGVLKFSQGQPQAGLPHLKAALQANPKQAQYWASYAEALANVGQAEAALRLMGQGVQYGLDSETIRQLAARLRAVTPAGAPDDQRANALLALFQAGNTAQAEPLAQAMVRDFPQYPLGWKLLAALAKQLGRPQEALDLLHAAVALAPGDPEIHGNLGNTLKALGRLPEAESQYRQALQLAPEYFEVHVNLGNVLRELGRQSEAQDAYRVALRLHPDNAVVHNNLGLTLHELGQWAQAEISCRHATKLQPGLAEAHSNLGFILRDLERLPEAQASCLRALALKPNYAPAHNNLGNAQQAMGQLAQAEASYRQALALQPGYAKAFNNLGSVLHELNRPDDAEAALREALRIQPGYAEALSNLGAVLHDLGRSVEAMECLQLAMRNKPGQVESHNNLGILLNDLGRRDEAITSYQEALQLRPQHAESHNNLGIVLNDIGRQDEAIACFKLALQLRPQYAEAHNNLGTALKDLGQFDEALACFHRALDIKPDYPEAYDNLLFVLNYHPDKSAEQVFAAYLDYDRRFGHPPQRMPAAGAPQGETRQRLRVGYVSPDFRQHSCVYFLEPLLAGHDRRAFEVFAYAELAVEDATTARYKSYVDHWVPTRGMSNDVLAQRIRADGIDILVDLAGHTRGNRLPVFARRPAPIAASWLGFGYTTGLKAIDYFLTDTQVAPPGSEPLFSETPWRLDGPALIYRPAAAMGEAGPLPALENGCVTFGTLTRSIRINHKTVRAWVAILQQVQGSRLIINSGDFRSRQRQDEMAEQFVKLGIARERLLIGHTPAWDVLRQMDIGLDCFPHNSGTTLFESLYMGVPFVTLADRPGVGRLGSSILHGLGQPHWVADNEADYAARAVALATDLPALGTLRAGLRQQMQRSALMDETSHVRRVEAAYRMMWERHIG